jgi:hypothetical protein
MLRKRNLYVWGEECTMLKMPQGKVKEKNPTI